VSRAAVELTVTSARRRRRPAARPAQVDGDHVGATAAHQHVAAAPRLRRDAHVDVDGARPGAAYEGDHSRDGAPRSRAAPACPPRIPPGGAGVRAQVKAGGCGCGCGCKVLMQHRIEHAAHCPSLVPLSAARSLADSPFRVFYNLNMLPKLFDDLIDAVDILYGSFVRLNL
jgi:hypothetical protein